MKDVWLLLEDQFGMEERVWGQRFVEVSAETFALNSFDVFLNVLQSFEKVVGKLEINAVSDEMRRFVVSERLNAHANEFLDESAQKRLVTMRKAMIEGKPFDKLTSW